MFEVCCILGTALGLALIGVCLILAICERNDADDQAAADADAGRNEPARSPQRPGFRGRPGRCRRSYLVLQS